MILFPLVRLAVILAVILAVMAADGGAAQASHTGAPAKVCHEDAPCWNWATMGNLQRGIVTVSGRRAVVSPCQYRILRTHGRIDHARTPRLRGDAFALRNGCRPTLYAL